MNKHKLFFFITILLLGFLIAKKLNFKKNSSSEKVLHTEVYRQIVTLDPQKVEDVTSVIQVSKVYEGLLEYSYLERPAKIIPNLAESMPEISNNDKTYTFKIKKGVMFQDNKCFPGGKGRELKANDFIFTIKRFSDPKNSAPLYCFIDGLILGLNEWRSNLNSIGKFDDEIEGIKIIDDYTFSITLLKNDPQFLYNFCMPHFYLMAKEAVDFYGEDIAINPVGTGPFIVENYDPQSNKLVAIKNKNYREKYYPSESADEFKHLLIDAGKRLPLVDKVVTYVILEEQTRWLKFLNKELDILDLCNCSNLDAKINGNEPTEELKNKGIKLAKDSFSHTAFFTINHKDSLLQNIHLRRAMSLAYDRTEEIRLFFSGLYSVAHGLIPKSMSGYDDNYRSGFTEMNIDQAKKELELAGFPNGKGLPTIKLEIRQGTLELQQAEYFKKCLNKIGINLDININSMPELVNKIRQGNYQLAMMQWFADFPDAITFFSLFYSPKSSNGVYTFYKNDKFDSLYEEAISSTKTSEEIVDLYKKLNSIVCEDIAVITKYHNNSLIMYHSKVKNFAILDSKFNYFEYINLE